MKQINMLFDQMDLWRHLPSYQLERRVDLFFSLYLPEVLEAKLGFPVHRDIIPEFPLRIGNLDLDKISDIEKKENLSYKVDYFALAEDGKESILVELKTDQLSKRKEQERYLEAAGEKEMKELIEGVIKLFQTTKSKRKYYFLLEQLYKMGLIQIPERMRRIALRPNLKGMTEASSGIINTASVSKPTVIYVLPTESNETKISFTQISFDDFRDEVKKHDDPLSARFSESLKEWSTVQAGYKHGGRK